MRIGLTGGAATAEGVIGQARRAEEDGFAALWYPSAVLGDPMVALALAGRATTRIEVGTSVVQSYACHPVLQAARTAAVATAIAAPGRLTLGVGPSHQPFVEAMLGLDYSTPGRHTEEYVRVLAPMLAGEAVSFSGDEWRVQAPAPPLPAGVTVPVLVAALGPRLLRVAGQYAAGTITWMANARAIADHVAPRLAAAASAAGRPAPRIVAGLPVAVHDDETEAREVAAGVFATYGMLPNYQRILAAGGIESPAEAVIVGDEDAVRAQIEALFAAGATDLWAAPFPVGDDPSGSKARTRALLRTLATA